MSVVARLLFTLTCIATVVVAGGCGLLLDPDRPQSSGVPGAGLRPLPGCGEPPDEHTVALYRMDDVTSGTLTDATGDHPGSFEDDVPEVTDGPSGCGRALVGGRPLFGLVEHHPDFLLRRGAVDLWVRVPDGSRFCEGIVSRDASQQDRPGHFTMYVNGDGRAGVRLQSSPIERGAIFLFSDAPLPRDTWTHVGVNFGPEGVQLFVDGDAQSGAGDRGDCSRTDDSCTADCTTGIEGNENPWVIAAGATGTPEGGFAGVNAHFSGSIDELRISSTNRAF